VARVWLALGELSYSEGNNQGLSQACAALRLVHENMNENDRNHVTRAQELLVRAECHKDAENWPSAIELLNQAVAVITPHVKNGNERTDEDDEHRRDFWTATGELAWAYMKSGDVEKGCPLLRQAIIELDLAENDHWRKDFSENCSNHELLPPHKKEKNTKCRE